MELGTIVLDKERHLKLTTRGMKAFKKLTGEEITNLKEKASDPETIEKICWALLLGEDKDLTFEAASEMLETVDVRVIHKAITECMSDPLSPSPATS